jgi:hypothetical protein
MHCLGGASLEPPVPDGSRTPALLLFGRGFRFDNFSSPESGFVPTADRHRAIIWNSASASGADMWITLIAITLVVAIGFCALAFVVQFEP